MSPLKIDIVVPGRFHAFDLARALLARGHDVVVYTNYPKRVCAQWDLPPRCVRSFLPHGIVQRAVHRAGLGGLPGVEQGLHSSFGAWAACRVRRDADLIHCFSGVAEEVLRLPQATHGGIRQIMRGSAHIREQYRLLAEEEKRLGRKVDKPSHWMIAREEREYGLAEQIVVLSTFAERSFMEHGIPKRKLACVPLGVDTVRFAATREAMEERCRRIMSGRRLQVLTVGTFSARKGALDLVAIARTLAPKMDFRIVADVVPDARHLTTEAAKYIEFQPRVPQFSLPAEYDAADIFLFPTLEDSFPVVLAQAQAAAMPILVTRNCSGEDIVSEGATGWVLPVRSPERFVERLQWCDAHREELAVMVKAVHAGRKCRDWTGVADNLVFCCAKARRDAPPASWEVSYGSN